MVYRTSSTPEGAPAIPAEYEYAPVEHRFFSGAAVGWVFFVPIVVGTIFGLVFPPGAAPAMIVAGVLVYRWLKGRNRRERVRLSVDRGKVIVEFLARSRSISLEELDDVVLETKTIEPVIDGPSMVLPMRIVESRVGPAIAHARIVFEGKTQQLALTDVYFSHSDTVDQIAKIRVFLRRNGWVPRDERPKKKRRRAKKRSEPKVSV